MEFNFTDKRFLVTGTTKGIGRELAKSLAQFNADVYALGRNEDELSSLVQECGDKVHPLKVDLTDWDATKTVLEQLPVMNGLVNNAAVLGTFQQAVDIDKASLEEVFAVNIYGALNVAQVVAKKMMSSGKGGSIVNVSSTGGIVSFRNCAKYTMSKAALDMMTKQLALELGPHNIRVNSVNPAFVKTAKSEEAVRALSDFTNKLREHTPLGRHAEVSEVIGPIMYFLSDCSSMVTGTIHMIDGGCLINVGI